MPAVILNVAKNLSTEDCHVLALLGFAMTGDNKDDYFSNKDGWHIADEYNSIELVHGGGYAVG